MAAAAYAIKAAVADRDAAAFGFEACKTMYGGRHARPGDRVFLFASGAGSGHGLFARGFVAACTPVPRTDAARQTPRLSLTVDRIERTAARLGRAELRGLGDREDGAPEAELEFKLYRQATDKLVGLTPAAAAALDALFQAACGARAGPRMVTP